MILDHITGVHSRFFNPIGWDASVRALAKANKPKAIPAVFGPVYQPGEAIGAPIPSAPVVVVKHKRLWTLEWLTTRTVAMLRTLASGAKVAGRSKMRKAELVTALDAWDASGASAR